MKKRFLIIIFFFSVFQQYGYQLNAQNQQPPLSETNKVCTNCHGHKYYSFYNQVTEQTNRKRMNPYFIIDTNLYKLGVHHEFSCDVCHSPDYAAYPHVSELKLEPKLTCIDCHGGDETFATYQFDDIEKEVANSVHATASGLQFGCSYCHNQHTYRSVARNETSKIRDIVINNNQMCLRCHNDLTKYQVLTDNSKPELLKTHSWLPNQELHFLSVRCIECHTPITDTLMVSHKILPKTEAIRECRSCHSTNSILSGKLYKYATKQLRSDKGYYNAIILNEAYVIGANRNIYLNIISLLIFGATVFGIAFHIVVRIIKKR